MSDDGVLCIVEIPKRSRNKYEYDPGCGAIKLDRRLVSSVGCPIDYDDVPGTVAAGGDPLDVMVCVSEPTFPGCRIWARPIALFPMDDEKGRDDKQLSLEIAHVFSIYKQPAGHRVQVHGWSSATEALGVLATSRRRGAEGHG